MSFFDIWTGSRSQLRKLKLEWEAKLESATAENKQDLLDDIEVMKCVLGNSDTKDESDEESEGVDDDESDDRWKVTLCTDTYPTLNHVMSYLYKNKMETVLHVNEAEVITCVTVNGKHYLRYGYDLDNLFKLYSKYAKSTTTIKIPEVYPDREYIPLISEIPSPVTRAIISDYKYFCAYVFYLMYFYGDYGHRIFQIVNKDNNWIVNFIRLEGLKPNTRLDGVRVGRWECGGSCSPLSTN